MLAWLVGRSFGDGTRSPLRCRLVSFHPQFSRWLMPRNGQFLSEPILTELRNKGLAFIEGRFESVGLLTKNVKSKQKGEGVVMTCFPIFSVEISRWI